MATKAFAQRIPSLHNGISTQAPSSRFPSQVADAENALFSVVNGVSSRGGTRHLVTLDANGSNGTALGSSQHRMHRIVRDGEERYAVVYGRTSNSLMGIDVVDLLNPRNRIQYFTLGGATAGTFEITFGNQTTSAIAYNASASTIAAAIAALSSVGGAGNVSVTASGSWFVVTFADTVPYDGLMEIGTVGWTGGTGVDGPYGTAAKVTGLTGAVQTYLESGSSDADDLRMITIVDTTIIANTLVATAASGTSLTATSMPVKMTRTSVVPPTFALAQITWNTGPVSSLAPQPIRDGKRISDVAYHRGRLCFAMDEWLVTSQADSLYNFYPVSTTAVGASDPIVAQIGSSSVSVIDYLVPFRKSLLVLTRNGAQFEIGGGETFTPTNATLTASTTYSTQSVRPAPISSFIYFAGIRENTSVVYEYAYDDIQVSYRATAITQHVEGLLPTGIRSMVASDNNDTLVVVPSSIAPDPASAVGSNTLGGGLWSNQNTWSGGSIPSPAHVVEILPGDVVTFDSYRNSSSGLFLYRMLRIADKLVQSAWTKYTFQDDRILDAIVVDDTAYILRIAYSADKGSGKNAAFYRLVVDSMPISSDPAPPATFQEQPRLDHRRVIRGGTYAAGNTTWRIDLVDRDMNTCVAMVNGAWTQFPVTVTDILGSSDGLVTVEGVDLTGNLVVLGRSMPFSVTTTRLFRTDDQGNAIVEGELFVNKVVTDHTNSGPYRIVAMTEGRQDRKFEFDPPAGDFDAYGRKSAWAPGRAQAMSIRVENVDARPAIITGIEFYGTHNTATEG